MDEIITNDAIKSIIQQVFSIEDITTGSPKDGFQIRYRGHLVLEDTEKAFAELEDKLRPYNYRPLFRKDGGRHAILLLEGIPNPKPSNPWINVLFFALTVISVLLTGAFYNSEQQLTGELLSDARIVLSKFADLSVFTHGWPFAVSMLSILLAHEFGHYLMGRHYGIRMTLPYFIPMPFTAFGTLGAVIAMKEAPKNRRQLLDIGLAGPLAGLVLAIPILFFGLKLSSTDILPAAIAANSATVPSLEGNSILYMLLKYMAFGRLLPAPVDYGSFGPVVYWIRYFFSGTPYPAGGTDVMLNAVAWAGWAGLLVTALNLIPAGQLDGGHALYVLLGKERMQKLYPALMVILIGMGFVFMGWWLWAAILLVFGRLYDDPADQITELDGKRKALAVLGLIIFVLVFVPVPITIPG
jgi:membrane-associated protease RseP (regulator of RpoE activity)